MTRTHYLVGLAISLCVLAASSARGIDCCSVVTGTCCDTGTVNPPPGCVPTAAGCTGIFFLDARCEETIPGFSVCDQDLDDDGFTPAQGDCDDSDPAINPDATEVCDLVDNDCNGLLDEGVITCGVGACERTVLACSGGQPQTCTPKDPTPEICDRVDNDCDGAVDEEADLGSTTCGVGGCQRTVRNCVRGEVKECIPGTARTEVCDGVDNDCDGSADEGLTCEPDVDNDLDGFVEDPREPNGGDCNDEDPTINPDAEEIPGNGVDENCDRLDARLAPLLLPCGKQISNWGTRFVSVKQRGLTRCIRRLLDCQLACEDNPGAPNAAADLQSCRTNALFRCDREIGRISGARSLFVKRFRKGCVDLRIKDLVASAAGLGFELTECGEDLEGLAEDAEIPDAFLDCLLAQLEVRAEELVGELQPRGGDLLDQSGIGGFPGIPRPATPEVCP